MSGHKWHLRLSCDLFLRERELSSHPCHKFGNLGWMCFPMSSSTFLSQTYHDTQTHSPFLSPSSQISGNNPCVSPGAETIIALPLFCLRRLASLHRSQCLKQQSSHLAWAGGSDTELELRTGTKKGKLGATYRGGLVGFVSRSGPCQEHIPALFPAR